MTAPSSTGLGAQRRFAITRTLDEIRSIAADGAVDRATLATIVGRLEQLAAQKALFSRADFPPPTGGVGAATRYRLNPDDGDEGIALYLNSINPGKTTLPHNHTTWAIIVAVEGQEQNRIYHRTDDGSNPAVAKLELVREVTVEPGAPMAFLPDDIHSIAVIGSTPTLHFHLYGRPLETLTRRFGVELETGAVINYNATQMEPSLLAPA